MIAYLMHQGWRLVQYPIEIAINALLLWAVLNLLAPPRLVIEEAREAPRTEYDLAPGVMRRHWNFPFLKCLLCSALLLGVGLFSSVPVMLLQARGMIFFLMLFFFGSRWAVSLVFEGSRGQHVVIFLIYLAVSFGVETAIGWIV